MANGNLASMRLAALTLQPATANRNVVIHTMDAAAAGALQPAPAQPNVGVMLAGATLEMQPQHLVTVINPDLLRTIGDFGVQPQGVPRSALHLPTMITTDAAPTDQSAFEDPDDASKHYSLGGFQLAMAVDGTTQVKWVELRPATGGAGFELEVHLASQPVSGSNPVPGNVTTRCFVHATVQGMIREWDFGEVTVTGTIWKLLLKLDGDDRLAQRDALYRAMTGAPDAKLIVRRSLSLASLLAAPPPFPPRFPRGPWFPRPIRRFPDGPPVILDGPPVIRDDPGPHTETLYRVSTVAIDSTVDFTFSPDLDKNVFAKVTGVGATPSGWNHLRVLWQPDPSQPGRWHSYYQDRAEPRAIYFLPDEFRIRRRPESPHRPWLSVTVLDDATKLSLGYVAVPEWDPARIAAAVPELERLGAPAALPSPQPFAAGNARLRLKLPKGDPSGGPGFVDQAGADIQTDAAVNGTVTLSIDDFKPVFDALVDDDSDLLSGTVDVVVDGDTTSIPFVARASRFSGPLFDVDVAPDAASGGAKVTVRNGIESSVRITALPVAFVRAGQPVASQVTSMAPPVPTTLTAAADGSGGAIEIVVVPQDGAVGDAQVQCDLSHVQVIVDGSALLDTILDDNAVAHATLDVNVHLLASAFNPPAAPASGGAARPALMAVVVEFETGQSASFEKAAPADGSPFLTQKVTLQLPPRDFLLGHLAGTAAQYRYRLMLVTDAGVQAPGGWQTYGLPDLYVVVPATNG